MTAADENSDSAQETGTDSGQRDVVPGSAPQAAGSSPGIDADFAGVATPPVGASKDPATTADEVEQESDASE